tara:strand:- start:9142 stop:9462 length:321 start_codon:yes stop_codon:yes gene_type:complete
MVKRLEKESVYAKYDLDGDNTVSDAELQTAKDIKQTEDELRKHLAQLRMARYTLISMGLFTLAMFFIEIERVEALADISNLFYLTGGGIVVGYMGVTSWAGKNNGK